MRVLLALCLLFVGAAARAQSCGTVTIECLPPFCLSAEDGALIGAAIVGVWAIGWGFRMLVVTLRDRGDGD